MHQEKIDSSVITSVFKTCPNCGDQWATREQFLTDPALTFIGYQANFAAIELGLLLFNHRCKGTLALKAGVFSDLYDGEIFLNQVRGTDACPGHCLYQNDLQPCPEACECAYVREIIQILKKCPIKVTAGADIQNKCP